MDDVVEVSHYVGALDHGLRRLREGFPLSVRLIREIHAALLAGGRGSDKTAGELRTSQNWIGGTRPGNALFVPPPPREVAPCLADLERFLHDQPERTPTLIKSALAHVQFETIHPFLDGNGRVGRLLVTLLLCAEGALAEPLLYLSLYFKRHRQLYYELLQRVRLDGDWEAWLRFLLDGVAEIAEQAGNTAGRILELFEQDQAKIERLGRAAGHGVARSPTIAPAPVPIRPRSRRGLVVEPSDRPRWVGASAAVGDRPRDYRPAARPHLRLRRLPGDPERGDRTSLTRLSNLNTSKAYAVVLVVGLLD